MSASGVQTWSDTWADIRRSVGDFLLVPMSTIGVFVLLALGAYALDVEAIAGLAGVRTFLETHLLSENGAADTLLSTLAGGMITITSITFSLLLLAVQQSAGSLTTQVLDQFIRRRLNQWYFGVFVGVTIVTLISLATNTSDAAPVFSVLLSLMLTCSSLVLLIFLLYTTLNQMRANRIIEGIHDLSLASRERQRQLYAHLRSAPQLVHAPVVRRVMSNNNGYFAHLHLAPLEKVHERAEPWEATLAISFGDYVCFRDEIAEIRATTEAQAAALEKALLHAIDLERQRHLLVDPKYGVTQLATIGWTSTSTARSNPSPALACIRNLRDLAARWSEEPPVTAASTALPIVYRDELLEHVIDALESISVAAAESYQHQCAAEVIMAYITLLNSMPAAQQPRIDDAVRRNLSWLGDQMLAADLDVALSLLVRTLVQKGREDTAHDVRRAHERLKRTLGELPSRETRMEASA